MKNLDFNIYIPQTPNIFDEDDLSSGIWLNPSDTDNQTFVSDVVKARLNATACFGDDGYVDIVFRFFWG